jgi:hypothetical protein
LDQPALLIKFNTPGSKSHFIKLCVDTPGLLAKLSPFATIRLRTYPVIFKFVPCNGSFNPYNELHLRELELENNLKPNTLTSASWCKKPENCSPGQSSANLKVQCLNAETANYLLNERIRVEDHLVNVHKGLRQPMCCLKCQDYGHFKDSCPNIERCTTYTSDSHSSAQCNNSNHPACAACGVGSNHPATSPNCPTFLSKQKSLLQHFPENAMPYYPTEERWTWVQSPTNLDRPHDNHSDNLDCQNLTRFQRFQQSQAYSQQNNNRRSTDTYILDNGWSRSQPRRQTTLNDAWRPQSNQAPSSSTQPPHSQHSGRSFHVHDSQ